MTRRPAAEIPPHDAQAENAVLGAVMQPDATEILPDLAARLRPNDFYLEAHRTIFDVVLERHRAGEPIDGVTLSAALRRHGHLDQIGGEAKISQLFEAGMFAIPANVPSYVDLIIEAARKRELLALGLRITGAARNGVPADDQVAELEEALEALKRRGGGRGQALGGGLGAFLGVPDIEAESLVEGLFNADSSGWIAGEEKLGKTLFALEEAICLALGLPVCNRFPVPSRRRVQMIGEEDPPRRYRTRVPAILRGHGLDPHDQDLRDELDQWFRISVWEGFSFDSPAMVERLRASILEFEPAVIYVDVLRKVTLRNLNDTAEASKLLAVADELRRRHGVVFRILHHYRKAQTFRVGRGSQEISGSFVLGAWGEASLFFEPVGRKAAGPVRVEVQTKDGAPAPPFRLRIEAEGPQHAPTLLRLHADEDRSGDDADELVVQAIATLPTIPALAGKPGVPIKAVSAAMKRSDKTVRRALTRLVDAGRVMVTGQASKGMDLYGVNPQ